MSDPYASEIAENYRCFQAHVSLLMREHAGEYALMHDRKLVGVYPHITAAMEEGHGRYSDGMFSIQRVTDRPLDLGFLSHASDDRITA